MKVLVIPDVHLKPWMFQEATYLMRKYEYDIVVCLGDLPDDFGKKSNVGLYEDTFDAAMEFHKNYPNTLWCYGNHEVSYLTHNYETGYSTVAETTVIAKIKELSKLVGDKLQIVHRIDNVVFSHAGIERSYALRSVDKVKDTRNVNLVIKAINEAPAVMLWEELSPIWFRPQIYKGMKTYYPRKLLQVVGHTPVKKIYEERNILSCDSFSTHRDGSPYGTQQFTVVDTRTWDWFVIR